MHTYSKIPKHTATLLNKLTFHIICKFTLSELQSLFNDNHNIIWKIGKYDEMTKQVVYFPK